MIIDLIANKKKPRHNVFLILFVIIGIYSVYLLGGFSNAIATGTIDSQEKVFVMYAGSLCKDI